MFLFKPSLEKVNYYRLQSVVVDFGSMIEEAARGRRVFVVTLMGQARAVVLGMEQYRKFMEEIEITLE